MGRHENPIDSTNPELARLAVWLRNLRNTARLTNRELADRTGLHATTLQRAASGRSVPRRQVVCAYARACGDETDHIETLWKAARRHECRTRQSDGAVSAAPLPELVLDVADLSAALVALWESSGAPPLRMMEARAGAFGVLSRSTAHRIISRRTVPRSATQFEAFLRACELPEDEYEPWKAAYTRAWRSSKSRKAPEPGPPAGKRPSDAASPASGPAPAPRVLPRDDDLVDPVALNELGHKAKRRNDLEAAKRWWTCAAELGDPEAMNQLGALLRAQHDLTGAHRWWTGAAELGNSDAMDGLGVLAYGWGDRDAAMRWWTRSAELGNTYAMINLGALATSRGELDAADTWFARASGNGSGVHFFPRGRGSDRPAGRFAPGAVKPARPPRTGCLASSAGWEISSSARTPAPAP